MGIEFAVCVPFRSDNGGVRDDLWAYCKQWWEENFPHVPVIEGYIEIGGQFCRSHSINHVVREAGDWDAYVIADADTFIGDPEHVRLAVQLALTTRVLVYAHTNRYMLGPMDTAHVLSHHKCIGDPQTTGPHPNTYSGIFAVNALLWNDVRGFDERFVGWGYEDWAFMWACSTLGATSRTAGDCYHLWHPRKIEEESGQPHFKDNEALFYAYKELQGHPDAMREWVQR